MKLRWTFLPLVCALVGAVPGFAGGGVVESARAAGVEEISVAAKGGPRDFLFALSFEGESGVAVGDHGMLLTTGDRGATWTRQDGVLPPTGMLTVTKRSGKCIAAGQQGTIERSDDCRNWETVPALTEARLLSLDVNRHGFAMAVGEFGAVLASNDWGKTWRQLSVDWGALIGREAEPHLYSVLVGEDDTVFIAGEFELILRANDGGQKWSVLHSGERSLFGLSAAQDGHMLAVGQEGLILRSTDSGKTWTPSNSGTSSILTDAWLSADGRKAVVVGARTVLLSRDGGATFAPDRSKASTRGIHSAVRGVDDLSEGAAAYVVGSSGDILRVVF